MLGYAIRRWERYWMRFAGVGPGGRFAARMAGLFTSPYFARTRLAQLTDRPYVHPAAQVIHPGLEMAPNSYLGERVVVYRAAEGGAVRIGQGSRVMRDTVIETGQGGGVVLGADSTVHARCQLMAYKGSVVIGDSVMIAPACALYAYNHGFEPGGLVKKQPLVSSGDVRIGHGAWLGYGVVVLDGVDIGDGAVIGAGSVVTRSIPSNAIAFGNPARVSRYR
jgi:acetyltransferase-like isoleucine patch superfamily enzyme